MLKMVQAEPSPANDRGLGSLKGVNLLLVEDNEMDVEIFRRAMRKTGLAHPITVAHDGLEALSILRGENGTQPLRRPSVVLLDLNMPRMNGHEFLETIRADPKLTDLVVFILTTSDAPRDKEQAYQRHVAGYMQKSMSGPSVKEAIQMIQQFAHVVDLPH
ncbi:MAG: response regulator [Alphaproteobacteria bacterium]